MLNNNRQLDVCAICREQSEQIVSKTSEQIHYICSLCGEYYIARKVKPVLEQTLEKQKRLKLSKWVIDKNRKGEVPELTVVKLRNVLFNPLEELENNLGARYERWERKRYWLFYLLVPRLGYIFLKIILPTKWVKNAERDGWASNILGLIMWISLVAILRILSKH